MGEGGCLPGPDAEVAVPLQGPGRASGGRQVVLSHGLHGAQQHQRASLAGSVARLAGGRQRRLVKDEALIPVAFGLQEAVHRGGDQHGVPGPRGGGGVSGGRVQVGALGLQPARRLPEGGDRRRAAAGRPGGAGPSAFVQDGKCPLAAMAVCRS